jgi:hypothetical protein
LSESASRGWVPARYSPMFESPSPSGSRLVFTTVVEMPWRFSQRSGSRSPSLSVPSAAAAPGAASATIAISDPPSHFTLRMPNSFRTHLRQGAGARPRHPGEAALVVPFLPHDDV